MGNVVKVPTISHDTTSTMRELNRLRVIIRLRQNSCSIWMIAIV